MSKSHLGKKLPEEQKQKIKSSLKKCIQEHPEKWGGRPHTEETKKLISQSSKNRVFINNGIINKFIKINEL